MAKIFRSSSDVVYLTVSEIYVSNGGRRTAFLGVQYQSFFDFARSPTAVQRRTSVVGRRIFLPSLAKVHSISIGTMVGALRDPVRAKAVAVLPRDLFPMDTCVYVAWISPGVALLASTSRLGKSVLARLNFEPSGLSEHMAY